MVDHMEMEMPILGGYPLGEELGSEVGTELVAFYGIPGGNNYGKLDIFTLVHSLGPGSGTVGVPSDGISSDVFLGGNGDSKLEGY